MSSYILINCESSNRQYLINYRLLINKLNEMVAEGDIQTNIIIYDYLHNF